MAMLAHGNSEPQVCVLNLVRTFRGEVPYVRTKGIDRALIDIPSTESWRLRADAEWVVRAYEPRVTLEETQDAIDKLGDLRAVLGIS